MSMFLLSGSWETLSRKHLSSDGAPPKSSDSSRSQDRTPRIKKIEIYTPAASRYFDNTVIDAPEKLLTPKVRAIKIETIPSKAPIVSSRYPANAGLTVLPRRSLAHHLRDFPATDPLYRPSSRAQLKPRSSRGYCTTENQEPRRPPRYGGGTRNLQLLRAA